MSAEILKLVPNEIGDGYRIEADAVLEGAKGRSWHRLLIVGQLEDDEEMFVAGNANAGESLILMELAKLKIIGA